jgi:hypothetical protein
VWKEWRSEPREIIPDLSGAKLSYSGYLGRKLKPLASVSGGALGSCVAF